MKSKLNKKALIDKYPGDNNDTEKKYLDLIKKQRPKSQEEEDEEEEEGTDVPVWLDGPA